MQSNNPPQNCTQAFSKEGDQIFTNRSYTADQTRANFLSSDVEEGIRCVRMGIFFVKKYPDVFNPTPCFSLRHLLREIENQKGQAAHIQQQIRRLDEDIRQNQDLLRRAHTERKATKVTHLRRVWNRSYYYIHLYQMCAFKMNKGCHVGDVKCRRYESNILLYMFCFWMYFRTRPQSYNWNSQT